MELEIPNFSLNLEFGNFENETQSKRVKNMSEEELDKSLHYAPGKHGLNRASLQRLRRKPLRSTRNKNFLDF